MDSWKIIERLSLLIPKISKNTFIIIVMIAYL